MPNHPNPGLIRPNPAEEVDALACWQAHLDAGRIGRRPPVDPAVAAIRDANGALVLGREVTR